MTNTVLHVISLKVKNILDKNPIMIFIGAVNI